MKKFLFSKVAVVGLSLIPLITFAAAGTLKSFVEAVVGVIGDALVPLLFSGALALFIWGIFMFIQNADSPDKREKGKQRMLWGIIALFVMVAYVGLTGVLTRSFFGGEPALPQLFKN